MTEFGFIDDGSGNLSLVDKVFEKCVFEDLNESMRIPQGRTGIMQNVKFLDCSTTKGTCVIGSRFSLDRVVFSNFDCHGAIHIDAMASAREVIINGHKPELLIVRPKPRTNFVMPSSEGVDYQFDISGFHGEVVIVGVRGDMVRKNSDRHVTVKVEWNDEVDWQKLGIERHSYWRIFARKLRLSGTSEGVFSLPDESDEDYAETMRERELLERIGLCFE